MQVKAQASHGCLREAIIPMSACSSVKQDQVGAALTELLMVICDMRPHAAQRRVSKMVGMVIKDRDGTMWARHLSSINR